MWAIKAFSAQSQIIFDGVVLTFVLIFDWNGRIMEYLSYKWQGDRILYCANFMCRFYRLYCMPSKAVEFHAFKRLGLTSVFMDLLSTT